MNFTDLGGSIKWMKSVKPRKRLTAVKVLAIMRLRLNVDEPLMYSQLLGYHSAHTMHHRIIRISGIQF